MKNLTEPNRFHVNGTKFTLTDLIAAGYQVPDENRLIAAKDGACIKAVYTAEDNEIPSIELADREIFYFIGNRWMTVIVDPAMKTVDCVRFIKL